MNCAVRLSTLEATMLMDLSRVEVGERVGPKPLPQIFLRALVREAKRIRDPAVGTVHSECLWCKKPPRHSELAPLFYCFLEEAFL